MSFRNFGIFDVIPLTRFALIAGHRRIENFSLFIEKRLIKKHSRSKNNQNFDNTSKTMRDLYELTKIL